MAELITSVFVGDPERPGADKVLFQPGDDVPERFWPLMTNPGLWEDGDVPVPTAPPGEDATGSGEGDGEQGDGTEPPSGDSSPDTEPEPLPEPGDTPAEDTQQAPAKKTAARKPASGRKAAAEGTGGQ